MEGVKTGLASETLDLGPRVIKCLSFWLTTVVDISGGGVFYGDAEFEGIVFDSIVIESMTETGECPVAPEDFDGGATYLFSGFTPDTDNLDGGGGGCFIRLLPFGLEIIGDHLVFRKD
jgi:hypothetical protein